MSNEKGANKNTVDGLSREQREKYWFRDIREITDLRDMMYGSLEKFSGDPAFWVKNKAGGKYIPVSYALLMHDIEALGTALISKGMIREKIAVTGANSYEWIVTYLAVTMSGGVIVPIDKELSSAEIDNLLKTAGCRIIFYGDTMRNKIDALNCAEECYIMSFYGNRTDIEMTMERYLEESDAPAEMSWKRLTAEGERLISGGDRSFPAVEADPEAMSVLLFTSGTTGAPKGVMLSQKAIASMIMDTCRIAHVLPSDKTLSILPIHHTYECTYGMLLVLYRGASTAFCEGLKYITKNMNEINNTVVIVVPMVLEMIYDRIWKQAKKQGDTEKLKKGIVISRRLRRLGIDTRRILFSNIHKSLGGKLRMVIIGAAALSPNIIRFFEDIGITVLQGYGLTECTPLVSGTPESARERYRKAGSVGVAVRNGDIRIIEKDKDGIGRILFKGENLMLGYYEMPEENEKTIRDGWFDTGDLGFTDPDGWLYLAGREKNVIVARSGENVYPEEIEAVLNRLPCIAESMVYAAMKDGQEVIACQIFPDIMYLKEELGGDPTDEMINNYIRAEVKNVNAGMTPYKRIKKITVRKEDFVRTTTKKIKRKENISGAE